MREVSPAVGFSLSPTADREACLSWRSRGYRNEPSAVEAGWVSSGRTRTLTVKEGLAGDMQAEGKSRDRREPLSFLKIVL